MITNLVAISKGISSIKQLVELFLSEWIAYDIRKLENQAREKIEEMEVINENLKNSKNDIERRALLRTLSRLR
jgi:hypothetical protein